MKKFGLSKSKYVHGKQCGKLLYLEIHNRGLFPEVSRSQQAIFDQGNTVGVSAQELFPDGILVKSTYREPENALAETKQLIADGVLTIFEAAFCYDDVLIRVDILTRQNKDADWELIEVKSSTDAKEVYLLDIALQSWVINSTGYRLTKQFVMHLNRDCVYPDLSNLFVKCNVTSEAAALVPNVAKEIESMKLLLGKDNAPEMEIGGHCNEPYECPLKSHCWSKIPIPSVFDLPRLSTSKKWDYFANGVIALKDVPLHELNSTQKRMVTSSLNAELFVDDENVLEAIKEWEYPLSFLDFETINSAVPRFAGTSPYSQVPFQFSCHVIESAGADVRHFEYLHSASSDPRLLLIESLISSVPETGAVVAYNAGFEKGALLKLAQFSPQHAVKLTSIAARLVDLLPIVRNNVYHQDFNGSFSIKAVAPSLLGEELSYDGMAVGDGTAAQIAFEKLICTEITSPERQLLQIAMLEYCKKDTWAMVKLFEWLSKHHSKKAA